MRPHSTRSGVLFISCERTAGGENPYSGSHLSHSLQVRNAERCMDAYAYACRRSALRRSGEG
jgi:hypothetical protein